MRRSLAILVAAALIGIVPQPWLASSVGAQVPAVQPAPSSTTVEPDGGASITTVWSPKPTSGPPAPTPPPCGPKKVPLTGAAAMAAFLNAILTGIEIGTSVTLTMEFFAEGNYLMMVKDGKALTWGIDTCTMKTGYFDFGDKPPVDVILEALTSEVIRISDEKFLADPVSEINPALRAPTQLGLWLSVDANSEIAATATANADLWRKMTVSLVTVTWDMGNGDQVVCPGLGTRYDESNPTKEQSPDCGYTYRSKQDARTSDLTIRGVLRYKRELTGSDLSAPVPYPDVCRTLVVPYDVYEIQTVPTGSPDVTLPPVAAPYAISDRACPGG